MAYLTDIFGSEKWRGVVAVAFEAEGKSFACDPFVLVPHEAL